MKIILFFFKGIDSYRDVDTIEGSKSFSFFVKNKIFRLILDQKPPNFKLGVFLICHKTKQLSFFHTFVNNLVVITDTFYNMIIYQKKE